MQRRKANITGHVAWLVDSVLHKSNVIAFNQKSTATCCFAPPSPCKDFLEQKMSHGMFVELSDAIAPSTRRTYRQPDIAFFLLERGF